MSLEVRPWFLQEVGCSDCRRVVYMTLNDTEISKNDSARGSTTNQGPSSFFNKASQTCMQQGECVKEHLEGCWELTAGPFLQHMRRFGNYYIRLLFPNLLPLFSRTHHHFCQLFLKHFSQDSLVQTSYSCCGPRRQCLDHRARALHRALRRRKTVLLPLP